jgi:hypothetical protein
MNKPVLALCAEKKGEVVGPAGGETGGPRCLAEARMLLKTALFHYFRVQIANVNFLHRVCQIKNEKKQNFFRGTYPPTHIISTSLIYKLPQQNASQKSLFFHFFCPHHVILTVIVK